jgi:hypothetical protein
MSQKGLLKYALNKDDKITASKKAGNSDSDSDNDQDLSGFKSKKMTAEEKIKRVQELEKLKAEGKDTVDLSGAIRLPN